MNQIVDEWSDRRLRLEPEPAAVSDAELQALDQGALLVPMIDVGVLSLRGSDRIDFLHGQVSNEVRGLQTGASNRSLLLNHRGHALADMRVLKLEDELMAVVEGGAVGPVEESLRRHIIFDQVELERREGVGLFTLQGPAAGGIVTEVLEVEAPAEGGFVVTEFAGTKVPVSRANRTTVGGVDLLVDVSVVEPLVEKLLAAGAVPGGRPALELARVVSGIAGAAGEGGDGILPQEAGLEALISYRKGCYLGQEIMARIEARGKLRRELSGLMLEAKPAADERDIVSGGKTVGRLGQLVLHPRSGYLALAVLRNDLEDQAVLQVGGVAGKQVELPFASVGMAVG